MKLTMHRPVSAQHVVPGLDVDQDLRRNERSERDLSGKRRLREDARSKVEWCYRHDDFERRDRPGYSGARRRSLTTCDGQTRLGTPYRDAVRFAEFVPLHDALHRPADGRVWKMKLHVHFSDGVIVVTMPLATDV